MKKTKLDDNFKDVLKFSEKSLKEVWDNKEDEIFKKASELRSEHEEKMFRCEMCDIEYSKTKPCCKEAKLIIGDGKIFDKDYWYWFCPEHGRHDGKNYV